MIENVFSLAGHIAPGSGRETDILPFHEKIGGKVLEKVLEKVVEKESGEACSHRVA